MRSPALKRAMDLLGSGVGLVVGASVVVLKKVSTTLDLARMALKEGMPSFR